MNRRWTRSWLFPSAIAGLGVFFLFIFVREGVSKAQSEEHKAIDAYIRAQMRSLEIPGVALAVVQGDQIYTQGYGSAGADGREMTPQTPFLIASISKPVTALGVMQLVEAGKINLDEPVTTYLPWFQVKDQDLSQQITVRHLLNQTSGLSERDGYLRNIKNDHSTGALEQSIRSLSSQNLNHPPGDTFEYSNTNFDMLGLLIQSVSGQPYEAYVLTHIFEPLGMRNSYAYLDEARSSGLASGYTSFFGFPLVIDPILPYSRITKPSAGLFSSAEDLAHFMQAHLNQGEYQGNSVLSPAALDTLFTPGPELGEKVYYSLGWVQFPFPDAAPAFENDTAPTAISHSGDWIGYKSIMLLLPEKDLGIVVLMNKSDPVQSSVFFNLGWNVALIALGLDPVDYPPAENFIARNLRLLLAGVIILLLVELIWTSRTLSKRQNSSSPQQSSRRKLLLLGFGVVDILLAGYLLLIKLPESQNSLLLSLRFEPDIGILYVLILILTLGWGVIRTLWLFLGSGKPVAKIV